MSEQPKRKVVITTENVFMEFVKGFAGRFVFAVIVLTVFALFIAAIVLGFQGWLEAGYRIIPADVPHHDLRVVAYITFSVIIVLSFLFGLIGVGED